MNDNFSSLVRSGIIAALAAAALLGATPSAMAKSGYSMAVTPGSIPWDSNTWVNLTISNFTAGAAMDVLAVEPGAADHPLFKHENFLCTPHTAWHSEESMQELKRKAAEEVRRVLGGQAPSYQVNKF